MPTAESAVIQLYAAALAPPPDLLTVYEPDEIASVMAELETLEGELDVRHPGWRGPKPFNKRPDKVRAGIKLLLKRRDLLLHGRRDWGCYLDARGCAVALPPHKRGHAATVALEAYQLPVSASVLAGALGLGLEAVESAVADCRAEGVRPTRREIRRRCGGAR